ncbi:MAG: S1C family serine protease [Chthoniobacteraceae bacterium]|nr:S1C family serine protease [Chthoniobacteraceae bacterium]
MSLRLAFKSAAAATAVCCAAFSFAGGSITLAGPVADSLSTEVRQVFDRCKGAVVKVEATDRAGQICGTGFFIDPNGTLLTSYSVGGESGEFVIRLSGNRKTTAHCLIADPRAGIAMLKAENIPAGTPFLPLAKTAGLAVASPVVAVAYPMDMPLTPTFGMVAGLDLKYLDRYFATTHIRASVPVQRGQSGAPLLNMQGEVVGVVTSGIEGGSACFAIPIEAVEKIHRDYNRYGAAKPGWLGVMVCGAATAGGGSTAEIERLESNAPAVRAGLKTGDILLKIGDTAIQSPQDVLNASFFLTAGEKIPVVVWRDGKEVALEAEPAERTSGEAKAPSGLCSLRDPSTPLPAIGTDIILRLK